MTSKTTRKPRSFTAGHILLVSAWLAAMALIPSGGFALAHEADGHPAKIHEGSCDALGRVAFPLTGVGASVDLDENSIATPVAVNPDDTYQVMISETTLDAPFDDVTTGDHAVMLYDNDENMQAIACGNIGGALAGEMLITGLAEANVPGHVGFALFQPAGEQTVVTVIVGHAMAPVSASTGVSEADDEGAGEGDHEHEDENADHEEGEGHADEATPEA